eukprot:TRINITY_DN11669_c0_g1_i2.p1 TRINITY_DN11669_c0_g1~~TRINITY_DN11669_c0_g1_i2.p1  ORF type:complete len:255 (+),score=55.32 TRINITY_DN11669_c0_g1_i2:201-965(+)
MKLHSIPMNSFSLKQQILAHLRTGSLIFTSSPITCRVLSCSPFLVSDSCWSFPATLPPSFTQLPALNDTLEISKFHLIVDKDLLCMGIDECSMSSETSEKIEAINYKDDVDIKEIMEKLGRVKKQSKYKLSLPKSLNMVEEKKLNNYMRPTVRKKALKSTVNHRYRAVLKTAKEKQNVQIVEHKTRKTLADLLAADTTTSKKANVPRKSNAMTSKKRGRNGGEHKGLQRKRKAIKDIRVNEEKLRGWEIRTAYE